MKVTNDEVLQPPIQTVYTDDDGDHRSREDGKKEGGHSPVLPPELEQQIFTMGFHEDEQMVECCNLLLVAKRAFEWIAPLVYQVVIIHSARRWPPMGLKSHKLPRYGRYVHHLLLEDGRQHEYLTHCPNITNLALVHLRDTSAMHSDGWKALATLPLRELSIDIRNLPTTPQLILLFSRITHLDLAYFAPWPWHALDALSHFTSLTHLMMMSDSCTDDDINRITNRIPHLKVFIIVRYVREYKMFETVWIDKLSDPRVVTLTCTFVAHWQATAQGLDSENPWLFAEGVIARRQRYSDC
ncbi:hypothetical protein BDN72DRAFT_897258 [Pluteus cervinus]|uniref:Uncharacterized protein n=1 Tax=Pluteus cervinus TaxID=181527 RepID=A0ACD3AVU9_9AGAR|nr:hypothetical protein BDN72DRAFT_897258 [Pluteus cervinus]